MDATHGSPSISLTTMCGFKDDNRRNQTQFSITQMVNVAANRRSTKAECRGTGASSRAYGCAPLFGGADRTRLELPKTPDFLVARYQSDTSFDEERRYVTSWPARDPQRACKDSNFFSQEDRSIPQARIRERTSMPHHRPETPCRTDRTQAARALRDPPPQCFCGLLPGS